MNQTTARKMLLGRSGGACEVCGFRRATNVQHRKNRSQGGTWDLANLLHVCGSGTTGCHGLIHAHPAASYANGWSVRQPMTPRDMPAWLTTELGRAYVWLNDDGGREPVDMPDLTGELHAEEIHDRQAA